MLSSTADLRQRWYSQSQYTPSESCIVVLELSLLPFPFWSEGPPGGTLRSFSYDYNFRGLGKLIKFPPVILFFTSIFWIIAVIHQKFTSRRLPTQTHLHLTDRSSWVEADWSSWVEALLILEYKDGGHILFLFLVASALRSGVKCWLSPSSGLSTDTG